MGFTSMLPIGIQLHLANLTDQERIINDALITIRKAKGGKTDADDPRQLALMLFGLAMHQLDTYNGDFKELFRKQFCDLYTDIEYWSQKHTYRSTLPYEDCVKRLDRQLKPQN
jgi:hypothetical protein